MRCSSSLIVLLLSVTTMADPPNDQPAKVTIPLDRIWAYEMPETRDVWELEPDKFGPKLQHLSAEERRKRYDESFTNQIKRHLGVTKRGVQAASGFAVLGTGKDALRGAHAVLVEGQERRETFPENSKISLVFFSKVFDYYVHLDEIERLGTKITIKYFFVPHRKTIGTSHFALISLGELPAGEWQVDVAPSPWPGAAQFSIHPEPGAEWDPFVVCRPFSFVVEGQPAK